MSITDAELEGLGEEERAALMDDEEAETEGEPDAGEGDDAPEEQAASDDGDDAPVEAEADEPGPEAKQDKPFIPAYQAEPVADFDQQLAALNDRKRELRTQYQDGDLTLDEYEDAREQVETDVLTLREANFKATIASEQQQQLQQQRWQWEVRRFLDENKQYEQNETIFNALNANVIALQNKAAAEGKDPTDPMILVEAKRQFDEALASITGQPPAAQKASKGRRPTATKDIPPNLGDMPSAEIPETGGDEWAHLDKLEGMDLEAALAKLSPADQDRYLRG